MSFRLGFELGAEREQLWKIEKLKKMQMDDLIFLCRRAANSLLASKQMFRSKHEHGLVKI